MTKGLVIKKGPLEKILAGTKTWEIRGRSTDMRGRIALIESKSSHIMGMCDVVGVVGPLTLTQLRRNAKRTGFRPSQLPYAKTFAWVLRDARRLSDPVRYQHPAGAVIWVRLKTSVVRRLRRGERERSRDGDLSLTFDTALRFALCEGRPAFRAV